MRRARNRLAGLVLAVGIGALLAGCMPQPPADDNGDIAFVRQAVPKLLGRKPKGADEVELLADISQLLGREAVVRMLMEQPEFVAHWTDVLADALRLQRIGFRAQPAQCFGDPLRGSTSGALATFVVNNPPGAVAPGGSFNMTDLVRSAIVADDLSSIYRAYPIPLATRPGLDSDSSHPASVGDAFNHVFLNHQLACMQCHNSEFSTTNGVGWDRTFAIPVQLEAAVYGPAFSDPATTQDLTYGIFRYDQLSGATAVAPWGLASECGQMRTSLAGLSSITTAFAGASGNQLGLIDLVTLFKTGSDALKATGLARTSVPGQNPTVPGDQGYAYMVAATIAEDVWQELMGTKLTIANYYPRNPDQRNALWNLTEFTFIASDWSLKDLIARIMIGGFFDRKAPDTAGGSTPYRLQMIFDPWVAHDPRVPDPMPDPKEHNNGQGELVARYAPRSLLHSVAAALGWPEPKRLPDATYPSLDLEKAIGQYLSDEQQGTSGVDFQGLLNWEAQFGICQKPPGVGTDWVDRLISSIPTFDAANPGFPMTVADLVATMKDWLIGDASISAIAPISPDPMNPLASEQAALFDLFGATLNSTAAGVPTLATKARRLCGILLQSPRFMLGGIESSTGLNAPRLRVCNDIPCSYAEMCTVYRSTLAGLSKFIECGNHLVQPGLPAISMASSVATICPQGRCLVVSSKAVSICERHPEICMLTEVPLKWPPDPECGPVSCPAPWFDPAKPTMFVALADGAKVSQAKGITVLSAGDKDFRQLAEGASLRAGDILRIPPGAVFEARTAAATFATPRDGMVSRTVGGQRIIDGEFLEAVGAGRLATVDALLGKGADVNARDKYGETALAKAAQAGNPVLVQTLLDRGADAALEDSRGLSAADTAALEKQSVAAALLARRGAFPKAPEILAKAPSPREAPWLFLVAGSTPPPRPPQAGYITPGQAWILARSGVLRTGSKDLEEIREMWRKTGFQYRGEAGSLPDLQGAKLAVKRYMKLDFAKEHPAAKWPGAGGKAQ